MSSVVILQTLMVDKESVCDALKQNGETFFISGNDIIITSQTSTSFSLSNTGYKLITASYSQTAHNQEWLKKISNSYQNCFNQKLQRLAEEERKRIEEERKKYIAAQEQKILEKAKQLGYKIDKRVEKDSNIQLVLVKRTY